MTNRYGKFLSGVLAGSIALMCLSAASVARPITPAENRAWAYTGQTPSCNDEGPLARIQSHFARREAGFWQSNLEIIQFQNVRQTGLRSTGLDFIPRRYCEAKARFNDGKMRQIAFWIGEGTGMTGFDWGVEWCVVGLDRLNASAPDCKMVRP
jgi:hypothetical protein